MAAAHSAQERWRAYSIEARIALLVEVGRKLAACAPVIADLQAAESGQPYCECLEAALAAARCFTQLSDSKPGIERGARGAVAARPLVLRPDYPLLHWACTVAPLLSEGSTLVCVAPRTAPLAVLQAARCVDALPVGVLSVLVASPDAVTAALGDALPFDEGTTAAVDPGRAGNDAVFVSNMIGWDLIVSAAASIRLFHSGQRVGQSSRIYVSRQISHELADGLHEYLAFLECGDPRNPVTDLGPLRSAAVLERVEDQVVRALRHGALLKLGGRRYQPWGLRGYFFQPTLLIEGRDQERIPDDEIQGPVVIISPVHNLADVLSRQRAERIAFLGGDLDAQLRSLTAAGIDFEVANLTAPLERIMQSFRSVPRGVVRIETVTTDQRYWFPYRARTAAS